MCCQFGREGAVWIARFPPRQPIFETKPELASLTERPLFGVEIWRLNAHFVSDFHRSEPAFAIDCFPSRPRRSSLGPGMTACGEFRPIDRGHDLNRLQGRGKRTGGFRLSMTKAHIEAIIVDQS